MTVGDQRSHGGSHHPAPPRVIGVVLTDLSFRVIAIDETAESIFRSVSEAEGAPAAGAGLPCEIPQSILSRLRRSEAGSLATRTVEFTAGNRLYRARLFVVKPRHGVLQESCVVLRLEREPCLQETLLEACPKYNLTEREMEVLSCVAMGLTSKEVAERMHISPNTVKGFLRLIMIKTGAQNRAGILATLLAPTSHPA